jgi:hypothetical protein
MRVSTCCRARRHVSHPNNLVVLNLVQRRLEEIRPLDDLLLGADELTTDHT